MVTRKSRGEDIDAACNWRIKSNLSFDTFVQDSKCYSLFGYGLPEIKIEMVAFALFYTHI
jgi:hypothetical protein